MRKYFRNHYSYSFLYLILFIEDFSSSFRIQVNLNVWTRSIISRSISFYFYPTSFYWRGLNLHLLIRAICLQCWHEKWSLNRVSTSYKENNPLKIPSEALTFIFFIPFLLEFSSKSVLSVDKERWICFTFDPTQLSEADSTHPSPLPKVRSWVCDCPRTEPQVSLRLRTRWVVLWALFPIEHNRYAVLVKVFEIFSKNGLKVWQLFS